MTFQPPKGTDDLLAPESQAWRQALAVWEDWSARFGYPLVMTPVFESTDLFERGVGETTEIVTKQMFTFEDKGGRSMTLRPEGTAGVVRAFLESGRRGPWKGAYSGPFFRYEQPQAGRRRQFWQVGVEYLDIESPLADAEVIELGYRFIGQVGVTQLELRVNSLGDSECRPLYVEQLRAYLRAKEPLLSDDAKRLVERNPLRVLDSKPDRSVLEDPPRAVDHLCEACKEHFASVKRALDDLAVPYHEDPNLVRGLDYYTRTAFEFVGTGLDAAQDALGGGGRYDGLAEMLGGRPVPGVGFALGLDRIVIAAGRPSSSHLDVYLVSETGAEEALRVASRLRADGLRVDFDAEARQVKAQFRAAGRVDAPVVVVWQGDEERVEVRTRSGREQMRLDSVAGWLREGR